MICNFVRLCLDAYYYNGKFALHQRCYAITDFANIILPQYCYHYMKTLNSYFVRNAVGSTVPSLRIDTFQKAPILLLGIGTQYEVCDFLNCLDNKYNTEKSYLQALMLQKQHMLQSMFI
ncbi:restriction endonuclease subunit S [Parabacteroides sp. ZJ-118]|uniref:restriction endonuclease subunit S n=1 Tax=Parabacteroides sp. ZJ-118 TaxID=2709398 RepID=UPI001F151B2D|nr:restriction endonuclease subunit S [Parabacteroides sp. ZJ-118]